MSEWKEYKLSDFIEINPKVTLKSGTKNSFVEMKDLSESQKFVLPSQLKEIKGGAKFQNFDTLFARITPCLQNGKICQVKGLKNSIGFGSTEFLVFRGKEGISNTDFVYYLSRYDVVRKFAEQNMVGTSGRQRVSKDAFENIKLLLPDLLTQASIAEILTSLDDKITLNNEVNKELEALAQALFKKWFIDFEFPNENGEPYKSAGGKLINSEFGKIPKSWEFGTLGNIINKETIKVKKAKKIVNKVYSAVKTSELVLSDEYFTKKVYSKSIDNYYVVNHHWFAYNPSRINIGSIGLNKSEIGAVSPVYVVFSTINNFHFYIEYLLQLENTKNAIIQRCSGTVRQALNYEGISSIPVKIPDNKLVIMFNDFVENISEHIRLITEETQELINLRDLLLPKLISGELEINELNN